MSKDNHYTKRKDKSSFNNTKAMGLVPSITMLDEQYTIRENSKKKKNEYAMLTFTSEEVDILDRKLDRFDIAIMDTVYSMFISGKDTFTLDALANELSKKEIKLNNLPEGVNAKDCLDTFYYETLNRRLERMRLINVKLNCGSMTSIDGTQLYEDVVVEGYLLPIEKVSYTTRAAKQRKIKYKVIKKPLLYDYAEKLGRIITIPSRMLEIEGVRNSQENILLKQEIAKRIKLMTDVNNGYNTNEISYYYLSGKEPKGLLPIIGIKKEDYTNNSWRNKINKVHKVVGEILEALKQKGFIKDYEETRIDTGLAKGYTIITNENGKLN